MSSGHKCSILLKLSSDCVSEFFLRYVQSKLIPLVAGVSTVVKFLNLFPPIQVPGFHTPWSSCIDRRFKFLARSRLSAAVDLKVVYYRKNAYLMIARGSLSHTLS